MNGEVRGRHRNSTKTKKYTEKWIEKQRQKLQTENTENTETQSDRLKNGGSDGAEQARKDSDGGNCARIPKTH